MNPAAADAVLCQLRAIAQWLVRNREYGLAQETSMLADKIEGARRTRGKAGA